MPAIFKYHRPFIIVFLIWVSPYSLYAQKSMLAKKVSAPMIVDGIPDDQIWTDADSAVNFVQMVPQPGFPATEKTTVYFGFDDRNIYVMFKCMQSTKPVAKIQSRDQLSKNDDAIGIMLDTYNDNRTGYGFIVNPLGTQVDFKINDDGKNLDINWDAEWESAAVCYNWGWLVEVSIPFKSLKYKNSINTWGLNLGRLIRSNSETSYWSGTMTGDFRISQDGILNGIEIPEKKMKFNLFPYSTLQISDSHNQAAKISPDAGFDVNWQFSPNVSLNGTVNPDFATVEADEVKINLTRYELNYPEKRLFFQEGNEMYNTRIKTFYSRRIQDVDFGGKLNGKIGPYQFNVLNVGSSVFSNSDPETFFTAASIKRDFLKSSTIGLIMVDKSWKDGFSRSLSLDYVLNLGKLWMLTGQFVGSSPGSFKDHNAWYVRFAKENDIFHYHVRFTSLARDFRDNVNLTGFVTDDDRKEVDSDITYKWWIKNDLLDYVSFATMNNIFWSQSDELRSWFLTDQLLLYFKNKVSLSYSYNNEFKLFDKEYHNQNHTFEIGYNTDEWTHAMIGYKTGRNFDRDLNLVTAGTRFKLFRNLSVQYTASILQFKPDPQKNSTFINIISTSYNFTRDLWLKVFAQNSTSSNKLYFYGLFGWRFKPPFGALYVIYSHDEFNTGTNPERYGNLFLKLTYPISLIN